MTRLWKSAVRLGATAPPVLNSAPKALAPLCFLLALNVPGAVHPSELSGTEEAAARMQAFATCAGRVSALATRLQAEHSTASDRMQTMEADFDALVDAILPLAIASGADRRAARQWRNAGWSEMAHLMRLHFSTANPTRAARAGRDIARRLDTCTRMILPG
ncbi:MAG: hypothetical protein AAGA28_15915 [Pseudomonadota bacterium]